MGQHLNTYSAAKNIIETNFKSGNLIRGLRVVSHAPLLGIPGGSLTLGQSPTRAPSFALAGQGPRWDSGPTLFLYTMPTR